MINKQELLKLRPLIESAYWDSLVDHLYTPLLEKFRKDLETATFSDVKSIQHQIKLLRQFIDLRTNLKIAVAERE